VCIIETSGGKSPPPNIGDIMAFASVHNLTDAELADRIQRYGSVERPDSIQLRRLADLQQEQANRNARKPWPTAEQFDAAHEAGCQAALAERRYGAEGPREAPLSGEWADDITLDQIARNVGYAPANDGVSTDLDELADAWERGYFDTWAHEDAVQADEARED
jgi:hypothetical protein